MFHRSSFPSTLLLCDSSFTGFTLFLGIFPFFTSLLFSSIHFLVFLLFSLISSCMFADNSNVLHLCLILRCLLPFPPILSSPPTHIPMFSHFSFSPLPSLFPIFFISSHYQFPISICTPLHLSYLFTSVFPPLYFNLTKLSPFFPSALLTLLFCPLFFYFLYLASVFFPFLCHCPLYILPHSCIFCVSSSSHLCLLVLFATVCRM